MMALCPLQKKKKKKIRGSLSQRTWKRFLCSNVLKGSSFKAVCFQVWHWFLWQLECKARGKGNTNACLGCVRAQISVTQKKGRISGLQEREKVHQQLRNVCKGWPVFFFMALKKWIAPKHKFKICSGGKYSASTWFRNDQDFSTDDRRRTSNSSRNA